MNLGSFNTPRMVHKASAKRSAFASETNACFTDDALAPLIGCCRTAATVPAANRAAREPNPRIRARGVAGTCFSVHSRGPVVSSGGGGWEVGISRDNDGDDKFMDDTVDGSVWVDEKAETDAGRTMLSSWTSFPWSMDSAEKISDDVVGRGGASFSFT